MRFEKKNLMNADVLKNVVVMFLVGWVVTRSVINAGWLALVEYVIHILVIG
jgi:uncharacterized membrane protein